MSSTYNHSFPFIVKVMELSLGPLDLIGMYMRIATILSACHL